MTDALPWLAVLAVPAVEVLLRPAPPEGPRPSMRVSSSGWWSPLLLWSIVVHAQGAYLRSTICWNLDPPLGPDTGLGVERLAALRRCSAALEESSPGDLLTQSCDELAATSRPATRSIRAMKSRAVRSVEWRPTVRT